MAEQTLPPPPTQTVEVEVEHHPQTHTGMNEDLRSEIEAMQRQIHEQRLELDTLREENRLMALEGQTHQEQQSAPPALTRAASPVMSPQPAPPPSTVMSPPTGTVMSPPAPVYHNHPHRPHVTLKPYNGKSSPVYWWTQFLAYVQLMRMPEAEAIMTFSFYSTDYAETWYATLESTYKTSLNRIKEALMSRFSPSSMEILSSAYTILVFSKSP